MVLVVLVVLVAVSQMVAMTWVIWGVMPVVTRRWSRTRTLAPVFRQGLVAFFAAVCRLAPMVPRSFQQFQQLVRGNERPNKSYEPALGGI